MGLPMYSREEVTTSFLLTSQLLLVTCCYDLWNVQHWNLALNAILDVQGYVKQAAECLLITGQETAGCSAGAQLQRVMDEYCCLHNVKGLLDPRGHRTHMSIAQQLEDCSSSSDSQPDWTAIGVRLCMPTIPNTSCRASSNGPRQSTLAVKTTFPSKQADCINLLYTMPPYQHEHEIPAVHQAKLARSMPTLLINSVTWTAIVLQLLLGLSAEQKSALFAARRRYMTDLACISRKRHALLQQLQIESGLLGATNQEAAHQFLSADDIVQQLQSCSSEANDAFMLFNRTMGHKVRASAVLMSLCVCYTQPPTRPPPVGPKSRLTSPTSSLII